MSVYSNLQSTFQGEPRRWLVTGAAGFIGSHVVEKLLLLGQTVRVVDNYFSSGPENLEAVVRSVGEAAAARLEWVLGDIRDAEVCAQAVEGMNHVIHLAAMGSVPMSMDRPMECHAINATGTLNLMEAARVVGLKRFVYASSSAVYGDDALETKRESSVGRPLSPYAASKAVDEVYASTYQTCFGMETVGLRFFNVFGPRQDPNGAYAAVIPCWIDAMAKGEDVFINGDGRNTRDFCFVKDIVQALLLASGTVNEAAFGGAFNVGLGRATDLNALFEAIRALVVEETGRAVPDVVYRDFRAGDIRHSCADTTRVEEVLGFQGEHTVMEGLRETVRWFLRA